MKINIVPDMVEMVTAKDSQKKVSEIDYRLHLHEWICHPDLQVNSHVRKVTDQISDVSLWLRRTPIVAPTYSHPSIVEKQACLHIHLGLYPSCVLITHESEVILEPSLEAGLGRSLSSQPHGR